MSEKLASKSIWLKEKRNRMLLGSVSALLACVISIASIANAYGSVLTKAPAQAPAAASDAADTVSVARAAAFDVRTPESDAAESVRTETAREETTAEPETDVFTPEIFESETQTELVSEEYEEPEEPEEPETEEPEPTVEYIERVQSVEIEFERVTKESDEHFTDYMEIVQEGVDGHKELVYIDKYVDGELVDTELESETVLVEPIDEITLVGTQETVTLADGLETISSLEPPEDFRLSKLTGAPVGFKYVVRGTAKAYSGDEYTATGKNCRTGYIAVNPKQFPYGTKLWIVSADGKYVYGYCSAEDTGGFVKKKSCTVDLYMDSEEECYNWGHRDVIIYVL